MENLPNIAIFCDYENIAIGARDAKFDDFDIGLTLERLLDKGKIVVKKAYADWDRFKSHKRRMHEAAFELIEIPHVSYSGKNSADIRLVVDALDLCYTKAHVDMFVVMSGDSDFSPLVSKLRENAKKVVGLGVKNSSSDLLIDNCDEFIYYDDLERMKKKKKSKGSGRGKRAAAGQTGPARAAASSSSSTSSSSSSSAASKKAEAAKKPDAAAAADDASSEERKEEAMEMVLDTAEALFQERDSNIYGSMVKQTLKRKRPNFNEAFYGYATFNVLLEDAKKRGLLEIQKDDKSGGYIIIGFGPKA
ncbi:MAG: NYN domain-containing protein [Myxococcales bacterium]|nr:NYN domain-containing protein [Myxococcales bacterium]